MKKAILTIVLVGAGLAATATAVNAYRGDYSQKGPNYSPERHQKMVQALENNDYNAWKELMNGQGRILEVINEENFSKFAEARKLALEGKYDEANQIREELGLRTRNGGSVAVGRRQGSCLGEKGVRGFQNQ